jgi:hypothetical protein
MTAGAAAAVSAMTTIFQSETVEAKPLSLEARLKGTIFWISKETQRNTKTTHTRFQPFGYKTKKQTRVDMRYTRAQNRVPMFLWKHMTILLHFGNLLV